MNKNRIGTRDIIAVLISLAALSCLVIMFNAESHVVGDALADPSVLEGLKKYSWGIGIAMVAAAIAFILMGHENDVVTAADEETKK